MRTDVIAGSDGHHFDVGQALKVAGMRTGVDAGSHGPSATCSAPSETPE